MKFTLLTYSAKHLQTHLNNTAMRKQIMLILSTFSLLGVVQCSEKKAEESSALMGEVPPPKDNYAGFQSQIKYGEHLVTIAACNDCHTPKKMTPRGPVSFMAIRPPCTNAPHSD